MAKASTSTAPPGPTDALIGCDRDADREHGEKTGFRQRRHRLDLGVAERMIGVAGLSASRTAKKVSALAPTSMMLCAPSERSASEPEARPATSLTAARTELAAIEAAAARCFTPSGRRPDGAALSPNRVVHVSRGFPLREEALCSEASDEANPNEEPMKYLHTMIRVTDIKATVAFFELMGFVETRRIENEKGRFTLVFSPPPTTPSRRRRAGSQRVETPITGTRRTTKAGAISAISPMPSTTSMRSAPSCRKAGVTINRPPRDGHMAFIRTPDLISIELIQKGESRRRRTWASPDVGVW